MWLGGLKIDIKAKSAQLELWLSLAKLCPYRTSVTVVIEVSGVACGVDYVVGRST